jgi:membrane protein
MNRVKQLLAAVDRFQQGHSWLAVAAATWKKFGDDQAGNLAALIAYYAFAAIFPLLLVLVTVLNLALSNDPTLHQHLLNSVQVQFPGFGKELLPKHGLNKTGAALVIGLVLTLLAARGVASAAQNAMNTVWEIPLMKRPSFPWSLLRSLGLIGIVAPGALVTIALSGLAGGAGHVLTGVLAHIATIVVSLLLNVGLFWFGFRLATAAQVRTRDLLLSAALSAVTWQVLQLVGGYFVSHQLHSNSVYGIFGVVLGLLAWFYLQAQLTLYVVELNVVRVRHLWPRSMFPPPLTEADLRAYELYAGAQQRRPDVAVQVSQVAADAEPEPEAKSAGPPPSAAKPEPEPAGERGERA